MSLPIVNIIQSRLERSKYDIELVNGIGWRTDVCDWLLLSSSAGASRYYYAPAVIMYDKGVDQYLKKKDSKLYNLYKSTLKKGVVHVSHLIPNGIALSERAATNVFIDEVCSIYIDTVKSYGAMSRYLSMLKWMENCSPPAPKFVIQAIKEISERGIR
jgi:hypothetical protein